MGQKLGQHFLVDQDILQQMQRSLADIKKDYGLKYCLEIGPGEGALTKRLKSAFETKDIIAFEADLTLEKKITKFFPGEQVVWGDVLQQSIELMANSEELIANDEEHRIMDNGSSLSGEKVKGTPNLGSESELEEASIVDSGGREANASGASPEGQISGVIINGIPTGFIADKTLIAGNLPYYITSPILRKFFEQGQFDVGWFLIQKEVADKIDTYAKKKSFLRWIMNYQYTVETVIHVPPEAFAPPPRVDSSVITVVKREVERSCSIQEVLTTLDLMSQYSRKTLGKISKMLAKREIVLTIPESLKTLRVEELGREQMENIIQVNR